MWTIVSNSIDITGNINTDIQAKATISDPLARLDFTVDDPGSLIPLEELQDIIIFDETATLADGTPLNPTLNLLTNVMLQNDGGGSSHVAVGWTAAGVNSSAFSWSNNQFNVTMNFSNSPVGAGLASQTTLLGYVVPGVIYCYSLYIQGQGTINNIAAYMELDWLDGAGNGLGGPSPRAIVPTLSNQRFSIIDTAPAGAVYAKVYLGGETVNLTNSGSIILDEPQLEPCWFGNREIVYPTPLCNFATITSVEMPDGTSSRACRVFAGYIDDLQASYEGNNRTWTVSCAGPGAVLENTGLINVNYSTPTLDSVIIKDVIDTYFPSILSYGPPHYQTISTTVQDGAVIQSLSISDDTFRTLMNGMIDQSGYIYFVDNYYFVRYQPVYWDTTTISISDSPDYVTAYPPQNYQIEKDATQIKNRVKVVGGKFLAPAITDTFSGNGSKKVFNLSFAPYNVQSVTVGGVAQKTGVAGVHTLGVSGYVAVYDKGALTLTFQTAPASGTDNVVITYTYEAPVVVSVQSLESYDKYKRWFDSKVNDSSITSIAAAVTRGKAELTKNAFSLVILTLELFQYIYPGTTVLFTSTHDGYSNVPFTVQEMTTISNGGGVYTYQYKCGVFRPSFIDQLRNTMKGMNRSQTTANVNAPQQTDLVTSDTIYYSDLVQVTTTISPTFTYGSAKWGYASYA